MSQETLATVFGWMTLLNFVVLIVMTLAIVAMQDTIAGVHSRMFQMDRAEVKKAYFRYLANYKLLTIIFCLMPWIAIKLA